jgi:hypothetical protein
MAILTGMKIIYNDIIPFKGYKAINRITFEQEAYAHEDNPEYLEIRKTLRAMEEMIYIYWDDFPSVVTE